MSILNRPSDGLTSVLVALVRASVMLGPMSKSKLLDVCCPKSLGDAKQDMATKTLNRWTELGLFVVSDNDQTKVADAHRSVIRKANATSESIASCVRDIVLAPDNNRNYWSDEENKSADFCRAASWMLAQDVHQFVPTSYAQVEKQASDQASSSEVILFQNDTRWSGYVSWATFLGFGRTESGKASGGFITDPTNAVRSDVAEILPANREMAITDFLDDLPRRIPVLDGGDYRRQVEQKLKPDKWRAPGPHEVSKSLSRALLRLHAAGVIQLEKRADADASRDLLGRDHRVVQSVTHVARGGGR